MRDYLRQYCADPAVIDDVVLCIEEAATNAIRHSGSPDDIEVTLQFSRGELHATVADHGQGFDVGGFDPEALPDLNADHGRGLFIIAALMDSLELRQNGGLELHMARRAQPRFEPAALDSGLGERVAGAHDHHEARTRALLEEIDEGFVALDWEYRYVFINRHACRLLGRPCEELLGRTPFAVFRRLRGSELERGFRAAMELGRPTAVEWRSPVVDDWVETRIYPTPAGVTAYFRLIGERKAKEQERAQYFAALRESREFLDGVLGSITDTFMTLDEHWRFTSANEAAGEVFAMKPAELIGKELWEVAPDAIGNEGYVALHKAMAERITVQYDVNNPVRQRSFHSVAYPLGSGGLAVLAHDTTEQVRVQVALQASEEKYRAIVESSTEGIAIGSPDGRFEFANQRMADMLGYSIEELVGKSGSDLTFEGREAGQTEARARLHGGQLLRQEIKLRRKDGTAMWSRYSATPMFDARGSHVANLIMHSDVTAAKAAEEALRSSEERFRSLFEHMSQAASLNELVYDVYGAPCDVRFLDVNPAFEHQTGMKAADVVGRTTHELYDVDDPIWLERYGAVVQTGHPAHFEQHFAPLDRWLEVWAYRAGPGRFAALSTDITERKLAERERESLLEAASALTKPVALPDVLDTLARIILEEGGHSRVAISLWEEEKGCLTVACSRGEAQLAAGLPVALDDLSAPARRAVQKGETALIDYDALEPGRRGVADKVTSHLALDVPLYFDRFLGLLATDDAGERREFSDREIRLIEGIAAQAAAAIGNAQLYEAERRAELLASQELEKTRLLQAVTTTATGSLSLSEIGEKVLTLMSQSLEAAAGAIYVVDKDAGELHALALAGYSDERSREIAVVPLDESRSIAKLVVCDLPQVTHDSGDIGLASEEHAHELSEADERWFALPIKRGEAIVGVFGLMFVGERPFSDDELALYRSIAELLGSAFENARLFEAEREARQQAAQELEATQLLLEAAGTLNRWTDLDVLLNGLADVVLRSTRHTRAYVALLAEDRSQATFVTTVGKDPLPARTILTWDQLSPVLQSVLTDGRRRIVDFSQLPQEQHGIADSLDSRLALHVPIVFAGRVLGHIALDDPGERREFADDEIALIEGIASQAAAAIENSSLFEAQLEAQRRLQ